MVSRDWVTAVLLICLTLCLGYIDAEDKDANSTYKVIEHRTLLVVCNVTEEDDVDIYWTKNQTRSRFYQTGKNLMFTDITRFDSGDYVCHAYNTSFPGDNETNSNVTVEVVKVDVLYPMEVVAFSIYPTNLTENQTFTVSSNIVGNPGPNWEIRKHNGFAIASATNIAANSSLMKKTYCGDTGWWEVTGFNRLNKGGNVTAGENVTVWCAPRVDLYHTPPPEVRSQVGDAVSLLVNTVGYPRPSFKWSRNDGMPMGDVVQIDRPKSTRLNFTNLKAADFTTYSLTMSNSMGSSSTKFPLMAYGNPERPYDLQVTDISYDSVRLLWKSGFDMGSEQSFLVMKLTGNQFKQIAEYGGPYKDNGIDQDWTYTLYNLHSTTFYNITVVARNNDGFTSPFANDVNFTTIANPWDNGNKDSVAERSTKILIGSLVGGLVVLGLLAFLVYWKKYRHMRTSYNTMKGGTKA